MRPRSNAWRRIGLVLVLGAVCLGSLRVWAAGSAEQRAFEAAERSFAGQWWAIADREYAAFLQKYPASEYRAEVILRQAQARYKDRNFTSAAELLWANLHRAGNLADKYQFWLGEAQYQGSNYQAAAESYALVGKNFPASDLAAQAGYNEALAYSKLGDWPRVARVLSVQDSPVQRAVQSYPTNELSVNAVLLLAEAQLSQKEFQAAAGTLTRLETKTLPPALGWRVQYQSDRVQLAEGRVEDALQGTTNLAALATATGDARLQAETTIFRATILERLNRGDDAIAEYEKNLGKDAPAETRRQALLKIIELSIQQNKVEAAARRLESFLKEHPADAASDAVVLALGELQLKQHLLLPKSDGASVTNVTSTSATNMLQLAAANFTAVITNWSSGSLAGRAQLDLAWCLWLEGRTTESQTAFAVAARQLPFSEEQAVARFKWADAQFQNKDYIGARTNYAAVADHYDSLPSVVNRLVEPALYQMVRSALEAEDLVAATNAMARILAKYPDSFVCQGALLLVGESAARQGQPGEARRVLEEFEKRFPKSPLLPEVRLAVARTFEREKNWPAAAGIYEAWAQTFTNDALVPGVAYREAWANYQAGQETNALTILTNLVAQYPTNDAAALAQNWIADFYFRQGDFKSAEENYQLLFQKWPASPLTYQARMMAGRAAVARLGFADAVGYFTALINDVKCPTNLVGEALFAYGDATARLESTDTNKPLANYEVAVRAFSKLQQLYPSNQVAVLAWGRIGDCYLQLATADSEDYTNAAAAYQKLMDDPRAGISARSQAEVGLGLALDKRVRAKGDKEPPEARQLALRHFLNVVYEKNVRDGESADPFWVKKAGLEAAKLAEELQQWEQVVALCDYLGNALPQLSTTFEARKLKAKSHLATGQGG